MDNPNYNKLDNILNKISPEYVTFSEEERKRRNGVLHKEFLEKLRSTMKEEDEVFRALFQETQYTGSYYENLKIHNPEEFDINFIIKLPIKDDYITVDMNGTSYGFAKIKVEKEHIDHRSDIVKNKVLRWIDQTEGYLMREKIVDWLQGVVDKALNKLRFSQEWLSSDITVEKENNPEKVSRRRSGPAITLHVTMGNESFDVDLVPAIRFGKDKWPSYPVRQPEDLPTKIDEKNLPKWCLVPKAPKEIGSNFEWRISFYMVEKEIMNGLQNLKPTLRFIKLLRDKENWCDLTSYYIKTVFLWEHENNKNDKKFWENGRGKLLMHMLRKLEDCLINKNIEFFWEKRYNFIAHLKDDHVRNMQGKLTRIITTIRNAVEKNDGNLEETVTNIFVKKGELQSTSTDNVPSSPQDDFSEFLSSSLNVLSEYLNSSSGHPFRQQTQTQSPFFRSSNVNTPSPLETYRHPVYQSWNGGSAERVEERDQAQESSLNWGAVAGVSAGVAAAAGALALFAFARNRNNE